MSEAKHLATVMVEAFIDAVESGVDLVPVVADSTSTAKIAPFMEKFPDRLVNVGIAEQALVSTAAGLALAGKVAATCNAAPFLVSRANEQVKVDVSYNNTNVKLFGLNAGASYGPLASTHHCLDDISVMRGFGNIQIFAPSSPRQCRQIIDYALTYKGPVYIRMDGKALPEIHDEAYDFTPGVPVILSEGRDIVLVAMGSVVHEAVDAVALLKEKGVSARLIDLPSIRPLQVEAFVSALAGSGHIITVEEHNINGGLGSIVAEIMSEHGLNGRLKRLGIRDGGYALAADRKAMRAFHKLDAAGITETALAMLKE